MVACPITMKYIKQYSITQVINENTEQYQTYNEAVWHWSVHFSSFDNEALATYLSIFFPVIFTFILILFPQLPCKSEAQNCQRLKWNKMLNSYYFPHWFLPQDICFVTELKPLGLKAFVTDKFIPLSKIAFCLR